MRTKELKQIVVDQQDSSELKENVDKVRSPVEKKAAKMAKDSRFVSNLSYPRLCDVNRSVARVSLLRGHQKNTRGTSRGRL